MDLRSRTGLALDTLIDAQAYYDARVEEMPGAPEFSEEVLPWLRYLDNRRPDETWGALRGRIEAEHDAATRGGDIFRAIYADDPTDAFKAFEANASEQNVLDVIFSSAAGLWSEVNDDPLVAEVFLALIDQTAIWARIPVEHAPDSAEWLWSRMRCLCASAGFNNHSSLCERLGQTYPLCPMIPTETKAEWLDKLVDAHKNCGWPVTLGQVLWKDVTRAVSYVDPTSYEPLQWHHVVAMLHVLKHVRLDPDSAQMTILYAGNAISLAWPGDDNVLSAMFLGKFAAPLKIPSHESKKSVHPMAVCVRSVLSRFTTTTYLRRKPTSAISGLVLHGPWSVVSADQSGMDGFVQHGVRLNGVWLAANNKVESVPGTASDIVGYAWNHLDATTPENVALRTQMELILPTRFMPGFAFDLFQSAFPNLVMPDGVDADAVAALFDAPIVASLIRPDVPGLAYEFPIVAFLPKSPTLDESTNQGKSLAALTYARMLAPSISQVMSGLDSSSAPDIRDIADQLRVHGTLALDEFQMPKSKAHPLSRANFQLLCTGGRVSAGKVLENAGGVSLRHSVVLNAKALDFNPDMTNRTLPFYLADLTDAHRDNARVLESIQSGRLALLGRLQLLAMVMDNGITAAVEEAEKVSTAAGLRFGVHRAIAKILFQLRSGRIDAGEVDAAAAGSRARFQAHQATADDTGVLASLDEGRVARIRLSSLLSDLTAIELEQIAAHITFAGKATEGWASVSALLHARVTVAGYSGKPLCEGIGTIIGQRLRMANRSVVLAVEREVRQVVAVDGAAAIAGCGWNLERHDTTGGMLVRMVKG